MFCRSDCKSVFKVLNLSTEKQFSTKLALMNTQPQRIKVDYAIRTNDNRGISWCPESCKGKLLNLVSLTNLFEILYPRLWFLYERDLRLEKVKRTTPDSSGCSLVVSDLGSVRVRLIAMCRGELSAAITRLMP